MFKIFKGLYYKDCNSEEITDLINAINEDSSEFNNFLLFHLEVIDHSIKKLSESETSVLELSAIKQLVGTLYLAKNRNTYDVCKHNKEMILNDKL